MKHLFILGVGRSGTSLLQSMFAAHPAVAMLPETGLLRRYVFGAPPKGLGFDGARERDHRLQRISLNCWETAVLRSPPRDFLTLYRQLHRSDLAPYLAADDSRDIQMVGDKDPRLIEYLPAIDRLFPEDAYIIHIVRDPRDVLLSKIRAGWSEKRNWRVNLAASRFQLALADRYGAAVFGARWVALRYEDLIADPAAVLRHLCEAVGLVYDPQMLNFSDAARSLSGGTIEAWKTETLGPLLAGNRDKWKGGLHSKQVDAVEGAMGRWIDQYGYERTSGSWIRRLVYRIAFAVAGGVYTRMRAFRVSRILRKLDVG